MTNTNINNIILTKLVNLSVILLFVVALYTNIVTKLRMLGYVSLRSMLTSSNLEFYST